MPFELHRKPLGHGLLQWSLPGCLALLGCGGPQSTLAPAGKGAEQIATLFAWMAAGALLVWTLVVAISLYALLGRRRRHSVRTARLLIIIGGAAVPTVVLAGLLAYGLSLLPGLLAEVDSDGLHVDVTGEQFWWRVRYTSPEGGAVDTANELWLPVGEPVELRLHSPDVIHSLWVPALGGKVDMVPGRHNRLRLEPTRTGVFRGVCAEYCGTSHAWMRFDVVVVEKPAFVAWLKRQSTPARRPSNAAPRRGATAFLANGCGACHTVRGTGADGVIGPDLTHVGSRLSLAAGTLSNHEPAFREWLAHPDQFKPGVHMPAFGMMPPTVLDDMAAYLETLQ